MKQRLLILFLALACLWSAGCGNLSAPTGSSSSSSMEEVSTPSREDAEALLLEKVSVAYGESYGDSIALRLRGEEEIEGNLCYVYEACPEETNSEDFYFAVVAVSQDLEHFYDMEMVNGTFVPWEQLHS